jgi:UPF0716 family protein affecting phage T7 exclusion
MDQRRSELDQELRFAKQQQWYVAALAVALNAGMITFTKGMALVGIELLLTVVGFLLIGAGGIAVVVHLQDHMQSTRREIDPEDETWSRTSDVVYPLSALIVASALVGVYLLRFPRT